jgi:glycosyltransferase involved in cell wall biosynthesis
MALLKRMMARQTRQPDEWIVADGGETPAVCLGIHLHEPRAPGAANFAHNLLNGIDAATGDLLIVMEDDDWYSRGHVESMVDLAERGYGLIGSEDVQRYYNLPQRMWRMFNNVGASLCQTAIHRRLFPLFKVAIQNCMARNSFGIDRMLWSLVRRNECAFSHQMTVVGIKGLPGRAGLGVGHRPDARWSVDPHFEKLRKWIGDDADGYINLISQNGPPSAARSFTGALHA